MDRLTATFVASCVCILGCGPAQPQQSTLVDPADPLVDHDTTTDEAMPAEPGGEEEVAPAAEGIVAEVLVGDASLADYVHPDRGVLAVTFCQNIPGDGDVPPCAPTANVLCEEAADAWLAERNRDLAGRAARGQAIDCAGNVCTHAAAMEFDFRGQYVFEDTMLVEVVRVEGGLSEAGRADADRFVAEARERFAQTAYSCPQGADLGPALGAAH